MPTSKAVKYTVKDVGCYVDSCRGIYMIDHIAKFAESHGMTVEDCNQRDETTGQFKPGQHKHTETCDTSRFAGCEFAGELEDSIDEWMNEHYPVEGASWGRSENSDWGLWPHDEE